MTQSLPPRVAIVWGLRTPFTKAGTAFKKYAAVELAVRSVNGLVEKHSLDPTSTGELAYGIVTVNPRIPHLARDVVLRSQLPAQVRAVTLTDNCITGTSAIRLVHDAIVAERTEIGIAGGAESLTRFGRLCQLERNSR